jgi:hypothetical protein
MALCMQGWEFDLMAMRAKEDFKLIDEQKAAKAGLENIKDWKALEPYVGCVVAYQSTNKELDGWTELADFTSAFKYGLIQDPLIPEADFPVANFDGYTIAKVVETKKDQKPTALTTALLAKAGLSLRRATPWELERIENALRSGRVMFKSLSKDDACSLIDRLKNVNKK